MPPKAHELAGRPRPEGSSNARLAAASGEAPAAVPQPTRRHRPRAGVVMEPGASGGAAVDEADGAAVGAAARAADGAAPGVPVGEEAMVPGAVVVGNADVRSEWG